MSNTTISLHEVERFSVGPLISVGGYRWQVITFHDKDGGTCSVQVFLADGAVGEVGREKTAPAAQPNCWIVKGGGGASEPGANEDECPEPFMFWGGEAPREASEFEEEPRAVLEPPAGFKGRP